MAIIVKRNEEKQGKIIEDDGSRILIIHNVSKEAKELTVDMVDAPELRGWSTAAEDGAQATVTLSGDTLSIPAKTSVVIKENK